MTDRLRYSWQENLYADVDIALVKALLDLTEEGEILPHSKTIAARAGVTQRTLFNHFPTLRDLYWEAKTHGVGGRRLVLSVEHIGG